MLDRKFIACILCTVSIFAYNVEASFIERPSLGIKSGLLFQSELKDESTKFLGSDLRMGINLGSESNLKIIGGISFILHDSLSIAFPEIGAQYGGFFCLVNKSKNENSEKESIPFETTLGYELSFLPIYVEWKSNKFFQSGTNNYFGVGIRL